MILIGLFLVLFSNHMVSGKVTFEGYFKMSLIFSAG